MKHIKLGRPKQHSLNAIVMILMTIAVSCSSGEPSSSGSGLNSIIGKDNRNAVEPIDPMNKVVGGIGLNSEPFCTAFKIDANAYMTARHCVVDEFGKPIGHLNFITPYDGKAYPVQEFTRLDEKADLAYFSVDGYHTSAKLDLANSSGMSGDLTVYSIDVSSSSARLVIQKNCALLGQDPESGLMIHECDTVGGSSGSPILARGKVIGMHLGSLSKTRPDLTNPNPSVNVACALNSLGEINVTVFPYEAERCRCSLQCPGRCMPPNPLTKEVKVCGKSLIVAYAVFQTCSSAMVAAAACTAATEGGCSPTFAFAAGVCLTSIKTVEEAVSDCKKT